MTESLSLFNAAQLFGSFDKITAVDPDSPLGRGGAQVGDVIIEMQRKPVKCLGSFARIAETLKPGDRLLVRLQRADTSIYVAVLLN